MPRSSFSSSVINDDRQMDLCEFIEVTTVSRPFALWADSVTHHMKVVTEGDRPVNPRAQRLRAVNEAIEAAAEKLPD
jgi:hypothetical protein